MHKIYVVYYTIIDCKSGKYFREKSKAEKYSCLVDGFVMEELVTDERYKALQYSDNIVRKVV